MRRMTRLIGCVVFAVGMVMIAKAPKAQTPVTPSPTSTVHGANAANSAGVATEDMLTSTVHEVWVASGRNEDKFFDIVKAFAAMSAQKLGITLPDTESAGRTTGTAIKRSARRDPDQLLYAVVDAAVRQAAVCRSKSATIPAAQ